MEKIGFEVVDAMIGHRVRLLANYSLFLNYLSTHCQNTVSRIIELLEQDSRLLYSIDLVTMKTYTAMIALSNHWRGKATGRLLPKL